MFVAIENNSFRHLERKSIMKCLKTLTKVMVFLIVMSAFVFCVNAEDASGICGAHGDNLTWLYEDITNTLTVSGTGMMDDYNILTSTQPWFSFRGDIKKVVVGSGVTTLGVSVFTNCTALEEVILPNTLETIGIGAFKGCTSLASIVSRYQENIQSRRNTVLRFRTYLQSQISRILSMQKHRCCI